MRYCYLRILRFVFTVERWFLRFCLRNLRGRFCYLTILRFVFASGRQLQERSVLVPKLEQCQIGSSVPSPALFVGYFQIPNACALVILWLPSVDSCSTGSRVYSHPRCRESCSCLLRLF